MKCPVCDSQKNSLFLCITDSGVKLISCLMCAVEFGYRIVQELKEDSNGEPKVEGRDLPEG